MTIVLPNADLMWISELAHLDNLHPSAPQTQRDMKGSKAENLTASKQTGRHIFGYQQQGKGHLRCMRSRAPDQVAVTASA